MCASPHFLGGSGGMVPPRKILNLVPSVIAFGCNLGVQLQQLDGLLPNIAITCLKPSLALQVANAHRIYNSMALCTLFLTIIADFSSIQQRSVQQTVSMSYKHKDIKRFG